MIVCVCKRVNSSQIRDAVEKGAVDVSAVSRKLGLGTGCGRCVEFAERMIDEEKRALGYAVDLA
ncbi:MAG: bacterioferritin-associated ferredoxin [Pseudomonadota bacterium]